LTTAKDDLMSTLPLPVTLGAACYLLSPLPAPADNAAMESNASPSVLVLRWWGAQADQLRQLCHRCD
jgi:hypothetical protein